jgi:hypothetical protein
MRLLQYNGIFINLLLKEQIKMNFSLLKAADIGAEQKGSGIAQVFAVELIRICISSYSANYLNTEFLIRALLARR